MTLARTTTQSRTMDACMDRQVLSCWAVDVVRLVGSLVVVVVAAAMVVLVRLMLVLLLAVVLLAATMSWMSSMYYGVEGTR
jgi:hypothetical protein